MIGSMSSASSAFAMGCLNKKAPQTSLTQDVRPFDQHVADQVAQLGNHCPATTQKSPVSTQVMTAPAVVHVPQAKAKAPKY
jgi:hypothetical protein